MIKNDVKDALLNIDEGLALIKEALDLNDDQASDTDSSDPDSDDEFKHLQKICPYLKFYPNYPIVKEEAKLKFQLITENLIKSIFHNELRPGLIHWSQQLESYISEFGLYFTKDEHLNLIHLYLELLYTPDLDLSIIDYICNILNKLLQKWDQLSRTDLTIDWRKCFAIYKRITEINDRSAELAPANIENGAFNNFIINARVYFSIESTQEMLNEWRHLMCPYDMSMSKAFEYFKLFLPTLVLPHEHDKTFKLWANEFIDLWTSVHASSSWEPLNLQLLSRFASHSIGYFDWNPYIPFIFSYTLRGFGLPVTSGSTSGSYSASGMFTFQTKDITNLCRFIVSTINEDSSCLEHLKRLFSILRSFYYPSNTGRWSANLFLFLKQLPISFIRRRFLERKEKNKWYGHTPEKYLLNDKQITEFVNAIKDPVFTAIFSKSHHTDAIKAFQAICFLRPELTLPYLVDNIYLSIDNLIEPHRFTSILNCLVLVSRELVRYNKYCPNMQTHVIPLMQAVLSGIDANNAKKSLIIFQFLASIIATIPIVDCTPALSIRNDLSEHERELCAMTARFEDFIHEFFAKIFSLIETFSFELSDAPMAYKTGKNADEGFIVLGLTSVMNMLIEQSSNDYLKIMIDKTANYTVGNLYNLKAGKLLRIIISGLVKSNCGELAFKKFFDQVYDNLSRIKESPNFESMLKNERGDIEIIWNVQLLSELVRANGLIQLKYLDKIKQLITWYRLSVHKTTATFISYTLNHTIISLTSIYPLEKRSVAFKLDFSEPNEFLKHFPIRYWGLDCDLDSLQASFHVPNEEEVTKALDLVNYFIDLSIQNLNDSSIDKTKRQIELGQIHTIILGSCRLLQRAKKPIITNHIDTQVKIGLDDEIDIGLIKLINLSKPLEENIREKVINFILDYAKKLLNENSDDTKSLGIICKILSSSSTVYGTNKNEFNQQWKAFHTLKRQFENNTRAKKSHLRSLLIDRLLLQYDYRLLNLHTKLNELDVKSLNCLFDLSTSFYAEVRKEAQSNLRILLGHYPFSYLTIIPRIHSILIDSNVNHDVLKGCLYVLKGNSIHCTLMIKHNWSIINQLWPAFLQIRQFEKPSIRALLDDIYDNISKNIDSFSSNTPLTNNTLVLASKLCPNTLDNLDIEKRMDTFKIKCEKNNKMIHDLVYQVIDLTRKSQDNWKNQTSCFGMLIFLMYPFGKLNNQFISVFVENLIHENPLMRKIALAGMLVINKSIKYNSPKQLLPTKEIIGKYSSVIFENKSCPGDREDNQFHQLDSSFVLPLNESDWNQIDFLDKSYWGFNCWPAKIGVTFGTRQFHSEKSEVVQSIYKSFTNTQFVDNFIRLLILESEKGKEKFNINRFHLFKSIFRNFGDYLIPNFFERLKVLILDRNKDHHEASQCLASELIAGLIRGSKNWKYDKLKELWVQLERLFNLIIENITPETLSFWFNSFSTSMEDQDPRRMAFYINYFKNLAINKLSNDDSASSFQCSASLHLLKALNQCEWRIPTIRNEIFNGLMTKMDHTYKTVRERLAGILAGSLLFDNHLPNGSKIATKAPHLVPFVNYLEARLSSAIDLFKKTEVSDARNLSEDQKTALNFVHTALSWLNSYISRAFEPVRLDLLKLVPLLCDLDHLVSYEDSLKQQIYFNRCMLCVWDFGENCSNYLVDNLNQVLKSSNWHSRLAALQMIQAYGTFNLFLASEQIKISIKELLTNSLTDEQIEVRSMASVALSGFIHSYFVNVDNELVDRLKKLCKTKIRTKDSNGNLVVNSLNLIKRHGGVLGLCAVISAHPYDVPKYLPDVLTYVCQFVHDPVPIQSTIKKCLSEFRRTHHDNWEEHQKYFNEDQLLIINDVLISPNYYA